MCMHLACQEHLIDNLVETTSRLLSSLASTIENLPHPQHLGINDLRSYRLHCTSCFSGRSVCWDCTQIIENYTRHALVDNVRHE